VSNNSCMGPIRLLKQHAALDLRVAPPIHVSSDAGWLIVGCFVGYPTDRLVRQQADVRLHACVRQNGQVSTRYDDDSGDAVSGAPTTQRLREPNMASAGALAYHGVWGIAPSGTWGRASGQGLGAKPLKPTTFSKLGEKCK
jgi:hypothetical protein